MRNFNFVNSDDIDSVPMHYRCRIYCAESESEFNGLDYATDEETYQWLIANYEIEQGEEK